MTADPDARVAAWASTHHSLITREVAVRAGLSARQILHRVRTGRWVELRPGVWTIAGAVPTPRRELAALTLSLPAVGSHLSAAWLHGERESPPRPHEVTTPREIGHRVERARVHRTADLLLRDTQTIDGIRCTNAVRTCIDLGARLDADELERFIEGARHRRLVHLDPLVARFLQLARPGRDGIATVRTALRRIDPSLEPAESDLETLLLQILREHGIQPPVRQHPVTIDGRDVRIDVCYPELRIAIESDGFAIHGGRFAFEDDRERQNLLVLDGWAVLRFTWRQICAEPAWVAQQVDRAIHRASSARSAS